MQMRTYSELMSISSYIERFRYLKLGGRVGESTFGYDRWLNQTFYRSPEWKAAKRAVILRDNGLDLGHPDYEIFGKILVHHMNPISKEDIVNRSKILLDPEYLISTAALTHEAIHYGDESLLITDPVERKPYDTCPWR